MGSVTSALTRTRNTLVKVGSEPPREANPDPEPHADGDSGHARRTSVRGVFPGRRGNKARAKASAPEVPHAQDGANLLKWKQSRRNQAKAIVFPVRWKHLRHYLKCPSNEDICGEYTISLAARAPLITLPRLHGNGWEEQA
ncbi:hypothetical protein KOW79_017061 [Hemibagrus wyckioides]|uniref:Uncharacterized protein n=1 Tax=Hemibagrus wyckioides TaxID=337641 RepID=A0A9D3NEQ2_9TELE|nr:hypothetical protein KOW79_017061 [Hemibagrus wyckioides]